jgi:phosphotransferase system HPr-like phosphotransfer protein
MYSKELFIKTIENAKELVDVTSKFDEEIDLVSGRYVVDAKSIIGIFGLNLLNPVTILIHTEDTKIANNLFLKLEKAGIK